MFEQMSTQGIANDWNAGVVGGGIFVPASDTSLSLLFSRSLMGCAVDSGGEDEPAADGDENVENVDQIEDGLVTCKPPVISANHGHSLVVPAADVAAHVARTYSTRAPRVTTTS